MPIDMPVRTGPGRWGATPAEHTARRIAAKRELAKAAHAYRELATAYREEVADDVRPDDLLDAADEVLAKVNAVIGGTL